ncbi:hypothetical protein BU17DRAFT_86654 [Hysterangium stoloniferum]|nr:hypothetical protein BU17DRAFT_86654 [Hysterangium stoloniferum]
MPDPQVLEHPALEAAHDRSSLPNTIPSVVRVTDFSSLNYWEHRFSSEPAFEWLQPSSYLLPTLASELQSMREQQNELAILHTGCGSSDLSNRLRQLCTAGEHAKHQTTILNVDFSSRAIKIGQSRELEAFGEQTAKGMCWAVVDLLHWGSLRQACAEVGKRQFDLIVEKSCTDAIACGPDVELQELPEDGAVSSSPQLLAPEVVMAVYLGRVTNPGAAWIALSYSAERFDFLKDRCQFASSIWTMEKVERVSTEDHTEARADLIVHRPEISHFMYTIRRKPLL